MNTIYVFTSTGNSLRTARQLASGLGNTRIVSIGAEMKKGTWRIEGDKVGFVFPCYYGTLPQIVRRFIREAESVQAAYCFSFVSAGGGMGRSFSVLKSELRKKGSDLDYGRFIRLVSNYMNGWYYSLIMPGRSELKKRFQRGSKVLSEGSEEIRNEVHRIDKGNFFHYLMPNLLSPKRYTKDTRSWDSEFSVSDNCSGCGICVKSCPVGNITMKDGKPVFAGNCQRCMGCFQFCPEQAINIEGKPMKKKQYINPEISKKELFAFHRGEIRV